MRNNISVIFYTFDISRGLLHVWLHRSSIDNITGFSDFSVGSIEVSNVTSILVDKQISQVEAKHTAINNIKQARRDLISILK